MGGKTQIKIAEILFDEVVVGLEDGRHCVDVLIAKWPVGHSFIRVFYIKAYPALRNLILLGSGLYI